MSGGGDPALGTLTELVRDGARVHAHARLVFHSPAGVHETTVGAVAADARRVAGALQLRGIGRGDVVACQLGNGSVYSSLLYACMSLGAVLVPVVSIYGTDELSYIVQDSGARLFVAPRRTERVDFVERLGSLGALAPEQVVLVGEDHPYEPWSALVEAPPLERDADTVPDDPSVLIYTSGTTSRPKGVQHTHASIRWEVVATLRHMGWDRRMVLLNPSPAGHMTAVLSALRPLAVGVETVYMSVWSPASALDLIGRYGATGFTATAPYFLSSLLDEAEESGHGLRPLRDCNVGGAAVSPELIHRADRVGLVAFRSYGSSEHPTISQGSRFDSLADRAGTDGRVTPGGDVRIVDDEGREVAPGEQGEIITRGPEQFSTYLNLPSTEMPVLDGWFYTGDLGRLDERGFLTVTGRKKDIIIRGGENLSAAEIESVLSRHPAVREAAVVPMPNRRLGEKVCAFVVLHRGADLDLAAVRKHFSDHQIAVQKTPERLVILDHLPRTPTNKVRKEDLRALVGPSSEHPSPLGEPPR